MSGSIDWGLMGICVPYMTNTCAFKSCGYKHPPLKERKRLQEEHIGKFEESEVEEEASGVAVAAAQQELPSFEPSRFNSAPPLSASLPFTRILKTRVDDKIAMAGIKRQSNGDPKVPVGPHPSTINVSAQFHSQADIERRLQPASDDAQERSLAEAKEDALRLQGVGWLDNVRRALQLPIKTYTTACVYYHKFRLAHPPGTQIGDGYLWTDAAAASLLTACKVEDTSKKSRDILAASYNLKVSAPHEHIGTDDPMFEQQSRLVIGLERMVLESCGFDFRSRHPHDTLVKIVRPLGNNEEVHRVGKVAYTILTDLYRTFAPLKQTSASLSLAAIELAARLQNADNTLQSIQQLDLEKWSTTRAEIMETMHDALDLYTHHTASSILGTKYSLDDILRIRLALNKECNENNIPRYCKAEVQTGPTSKVQDGHPTPVSPPQPDNIANQLQQTTLRYADAPLSGSTLRFMLDPQRARDEKDEVNRYITEEWEEYEEEIEVPLPRTTERRAPRPGSSRGSSPGRRSDSRRDERERSERHRSHEERKEREIERARARDRDRERRFEERDRRYGGDRDRRYDDTRYSSSSSRKYDDDRRRRDTRR